MIKQKTVYITEDGSQFNTEQDAVRYEQKEKFELDLRTYLIGKDLIGSRVDIISEFIAENPKELYNMLSPMFEEI